MRFQRIVKCVDLTPMDAWMRFKQYKEVLKKRFEQEEIFIAVEESEII